MIISNWNEKLELLKQYLKEHNGKYPRQDELYNGVNIGSWINTQRTAYNRGEILPDGSRKYASYTLSKERIDKLNSISFSWCLDTIRSDDLWNRNYELLKEYLRFHDGNFPRQHEIYKNVRLGSWVAVQRTIYNNGNKCKNGKIRYNSSLLTEERIDKLNEIDFVWVLPVEDKWNTRYNLLVKYLKEHNGNYPKQSENYEGFMIGAWVNVQRTIYNNGTLMDNGSIKYDNLSLSKERLEKLKAIDFKWYSYCKMDYIRTLKSYKKYMLVKRKLDYKFYEILEKSENTMASKEAIEEINKEFEKTLTLFN